MHDLLDDYAHSNALRNVNPRLKLLIGLASILICTFSVSPLAPATIAISMSMVIVLIAKIPARLYLRLLLLPLSFALFSSAAILFLQGGEPLLSVNVFGLDIAAGREGANLAILLLSRTLGGTSALFFIAMTTPMIEIFSILKSLGIPAILIELSMLIYRYIFVLLDQAVMINSAQAMRLGNSNLKASLNSFSMLSSILFLRAWEQGERMMVAMDSRCYDGCLEVMEGEAILTPEGLIIGTCYIIAVIVIAALTQGFKIV